MGDIGLLLLFPCISSIMLFRFSLLYSLREVLGLFIVLFWAAAFIMAEYGPFF